MKTSCQVDFYVLTRADQSPDRLACQLALMAWEQGHRVVVITGNESSAETLDEIMWEHPKGRFLPHSVGEASAAAPVAIEPLGASPKPDRDVVINLSDSPLRDTGTFRRLLEIVPAAADRRQASRRKFREYRELGLNPVHHTMDNWNG